MPVTNTRSFLASICRDSQEKALIVIFLLDLSYFFFPRANNCLAHNWARWTSFWQTWTPIHHLSHFGPLLILMSIFCLFLVNLSLLTQKRVTIMGGNKKQKESSRTNVSTIISKMACRHKKKSWDIFFFSLMMKLRKHGDIFMKYYFCQTNTFE